MNQRQVGGRTSRCGATITQMLRRRLYVGIRVYNERRQTVDPETGTRKTTTNPRSEWMVQRQPQLQVLPWRLWKRAQQRLTEVRNNNPHTGKTMPADRQRDEYPSTLFSGTLVCSDCGQPLVLRRSAGAHKQFFCKAQRAHRNGCTLKTSKSAGIIEPVLVGWLTDRLLTPEHTGRLVKRANEYLAQEADRPKTDTAPLTKAIEHATARRDRLVDVLADGEAGDLAAVKERLRKLEAEIRDLRRQRQELEATNAEVPPPLTRDDVLELLKDVRGLLEQEIPAAARAIREITGPIAIKQVEMDGYDRPQWTASVRGDVLPLLRQAAGRKNCPSSLSWEFLYQREWTMPLTGELPLIKLPLHERIAPQVTQMLEAGDSVADTAAALDVSAHAVQQAWRHSRSGVTLPGERRIRREVYEPHAEAVARLRHEESLTYAEIAKRLGIAREVVQYAHQHWHHLHPDEPGDAPWRVLCGMVRGRVSVATRREICRLAMSGWRECEIVWELGCTQSTVHNVLTTLRRELSGGGD
ncbi:MAG: recombinase family protein [Phycisphaeraceae bacterium]